MMPEAHQEAIQYLVIAVGLIILAIFTPFILKILKKKPRVEQKSPESLTARSYDKLSESFHAGVPEKVLVEASIGETTDVTPVEMLEESNTVEKALVKTKENFWGRIKSVFSSNSAQPLEDIEEVLYTADIGSQTVQSLMQHLDQALSSSDKKNLDAIKKTLKEKILSILNASNGSINEDHVEIAKRIRWAQEGPTVLMIVGVNGAGKTTTIGKLSALMASQGKRVLVAAGDTFRAAAQNQLKVWTDRAQVEIFSPEGVTDPSAVAFDAVAKGKAQGYDLVIIDTAGRLHTQVNLMEELKKVKRVMSKNTSEAPHDIWIVLDANSGQNALIQAREFHQALSLTGVILTKMDGTAKGGVVIGISNELKIPIKILGIGEKINDLKPFSQQEYVDSIL
ncbi:MAG: signal recognition particle-docking protein FtsY [Bdellovibrionaceae bacterium]|nr:signal recognition particle-docking protein FtsY [Pseudobdellovibrionaceae bacterium]